ncbi:MAG: hypothetical protein K0R05_34 [Anaerocolumna sp.]|jgi:hypothetical protein|nr:hypothetical protein [Anaerocolumna sp.]
MQKKQVPKSTLKNIEKKLKPKLFVFILQSLILLGPYANYFLIVLDKNYKELIKVGIAIGITLPLLTLNWVLYFWLRKGYKTDAKELFEIDLKSKEDGSSVK